MFFLAKAKIKKVADRLILHQVYKLTEEKVDNYMFISFFLLNNTTINVSTIV